jgi:hypothetical protein
MPHDIIMRSWGHEPAYSSYFPAAREDEDAREEEQDELLNDEVAV